MESINPPDWIDATIYCTVSPQDPHYTELKALAGEYGIVLEHDNFSVGRKLNYAVSHINHEWFMQLGSDDIVTPKMWKQFKPHFDDWYIFGYSDYYFTNGSESYHVDLPEIAGAGRCIHRDLMKQLNPFVDEIDRGLDWSTMKRVYELSYQPHTMKQDGVCLYGIKSEVNIHPMREFRGFERVRNFTN